MIRVVPITVATTLLILTLLFFPPISSSGDLGLCLLSPNEWNLPHFPAWLINSLLLFISAMLLASANKRHNFVPEADPIVSLGLLITVACNCVSTATLTTSTLLLFANILSLFILISTYEERNATREFFFIGTLPAIGAMFQYSFLVMVPVYIGGGLLMKSFRFRELIAFIFGLASPYWIAIGLGWIPLSAFRLPESLSVFNTATVESDIFYTLLATGAAAFIGVILSLYNGVRLFSRNSRLRCIHMTFNLMGYISIAAVIFDFRNFVAYFATIALWLAIQVATLLSLYNIRQQKTALLLLLLVFIPFYILAI